MALIRSVSDKIIVMKDGVVIEQNKTKKLFSSPSSLYTRNLIQASGLK